MGITNLIFVGVSSISLIFLMIYSFFIIFGEAYRNSDSARVIFSVLAGIILYVLLAGIQIINPEVFFYVLGLPKSFPWWMFLIFFGFGFCFAFFNSMIFKTPNLIFGRLLAIITTFVFLFLGHALVVSLILFENLNENIPQPDEQPLNTTQLPFIALVLGILFYIIFFKKSKNTVT